MANKIWVYPKLALDNTTLAFFGLKFIDNGDGTFSLRLLDQATSDFPSQAAAIPDTGLTLRAGSVAGGAAAPDQSIQFNQGGDFAGSANLLFDPDTNQILLNGMLVFITENDPLPAILGVADEVHARFADDSGLCSFRSFTLSADGGNIQAGLSGTVGGELVCRGSSIDEENGTIVLENVAGEFTVIDSSIATAFRFIIYPDASGILALTQLTVIPDDAGTIITELQTGAVFTNEGAAALVTFTLPEAVPGLTYTFLVHDADGIEIVSSGTNTIRTGILVSSPGGTLTSTTVGDAITLIAINASEWFASTTTGTWTPA